MAPKLSTAPRKAATHAPRARAWSVIPTLLSSSHPYRRSLFLFAFILVAMVMAGSEALIRLQREAVHADLLSGAKTLGIVFSQNVSHTVDDLDRILKFARAVRQDNPDMDWSSVLSRDYTKNHEAIQLSASDANGIILSSTVDLKRSKLVDISDREHFLVQKTATTDALFISRPLIGRVSGKLSVQFSRRLSGADGHFQGILTISLDPKYLARTYSDANLGEGSGLALIGDDGVVRAGSGAFEKLLGQPFPGADKLAEFFKLDRGAVVAQDDDARIEVVRAVEGYPLNVVVAAPGINLNKASNLSALAYRSMAALASVLTLVAAVAAARRNQDYERRILNLAKQDMLTGLPNRLRLSEKLAELFSGSAQDREFALHIIDLDGFKLVNDTYGHLVGDELLRVVADRLRKFSAEVGLVARMGGDEFAIIQPVRNYRTDAEALALRVIESVSAPCFIGALKANVGVSIGTAHARIDGIDSVQLIRAADLALYAVKRTGWGAFRQFDHAIDIEMQNRLQCESDLRAAIGTSQFELHYQPILDLRTGEISAFEALLRWNHPLRGPTSPADFISIAEESGLIVDIGRWVIETACREASTWSRPVKVAVNLSPVQVRDFRLLADVGAFLAASGLAATRLELEVTEMAMLTNERNTIDMLRSLRSLGVTIAMDDFGIGYSSLSYLRRFPFDRIKIDQSFVADVAEDSQARGIIRAILSLAAGLEMAVTAEGVETVDQLRILSTEGCRELQGYLISRPVPSTEVEGLLAKWSEAEALTHLRQAS